MTLFLTAWWNMSQTSISVYFPFILSFAPSSSSSFLIEFAVKSLKVIIYATYTSFLLFSSHFHNWFRLLPTYPQIVRIKVFLLLFISLIISCYHLGYFLAASVLWRLQTRDTVEELIGFGTPWNIIQMLATVEGLHQNSCCFPGNLTITVPLLISSYPLYFPVPHLSLSQPYFHVVTHVIMRQRVLR